MSYSDVTIKRLFTRSQNQCAMPKCTSPILIGNTVVGEICHIRARRKNGPRFEPVLTAAQRDEYPNLILLCATCHKWVDSEPQTFTVDLLADIKAIHEAKGDLEVTPEIKRQSVILFQHLAPKRKVTAQASGSGVAVAVGGDNHGKIIINQPAPKKAPKSKYPANSIGADANFSGYIEYLEELAYEYWESVEAMTPGRIGLKVKRHFRLGKRTRLHLGVQRFHDLVEFLTEEVLAPSPVGKRHRKNGTKLCRTFEEWCTGPL
jgi:hypothetical protein